ncbi:MAG: ATP-binding protein [Haloplanus sp.]
MKRLSARTSGTLVVGAGVVLTAVHLQSAVRLWARPALVLVEAFVPLVLSLVMTGVGVLMWAERLVPEEFAGRTLAWAAVGTLALSLASGWLFAVFAARGHPFPTATQTWLNAATLGALVGLLTGVYDARERRQRLRANQLTRINDTLRIATREVVSTTDRSELEQAVCDRLTQSDIYDRAWVGRYTSGDTHIRPTAWANHDEDYVESLEVTVDPDDPLGQGPGGKAIRTGEIQPVQDVFSEPSLEPWWDLLESRGIESMAVVPLVGTDSVYGFLSIYANRANVFDATEQEALSELGESIGHAIDSMRAREQLAQRERERELARQNEHLDQFASVVSHDLRNPLNVAQGNLTLAQGEYEDDRLDRVAEALDRMDELIDDVLSLARTGRAVSEFTAVDLRSAAEDAWETTDTEGATLRFEDALGTVQGDESRLVQMFENLFRNAVEHGAADGSATVTVGRTDDGFYVEDDGQGIPEAEREQVFETGYSTADGGTGFGLNIVRNIAEAHGWHIAVTDGTAGGARFAFAGVEMDTAAPERPT